MYRTNSNLLRMRADQRSIFAPPQKTSLRSNFLDIWIFKMSTALENPFATGYTYVSSEPTWGSRAAAETQPPPELP